MKNDFEPVVYSGTCGKYIFTCHLTYMRVRDSEGWIFTMPYEQIFAHKANFVTETTRDNTEYRVGIECEWKPNSQQYMEKNRARIKELENGRKRDLKRIAELESWGRVTSDRIKELEEKDEMVCADDSNWFGTFPLEMQAKLFSHIEGAKIIGQCKDCKYYISSNSECTGIRLGFEKNYMDFPDGIGTRLGKTNHGHFFPGPDFGCIHWEAEK